MLEKFDNVIIIILYVNITNIIVIINGRLIFNLCNNEYKEGEKSPIRSQFGGAKIDALKICIES